MLMGMRRWYRCEFYTPHHLNRALRRARRFDEPAVCEVIQGDCLEAAIALKVHHGLKPAVLNMASAKRPGGGYMYAASRRVPLFIFLSFFF